MALELTDEQRQYLRDSNGKLVEVVDPQTQRVYVLLPREQFEQVRSQLPSNPSEEIVIPEGIRRSREALRRDLPGLLAQPKLRHQWVAYYREERIGINSDEYPLQLECIRRGLAENDYYIGKIDELELIEEWELDPFPPSVIGESPVEELDR